MDIRAIREGDQRAIAHFCQHTWDDQPDYIAEVIDTWMADPTGQIWVAAIAGQVVGMTRLVRLSEEEGWWEGLRVDRSYRRLGLGAKLSETTLQAAKQWGLRTLRTAILQTNTPMHPFAQQWGYRPLADYGVYGAAAQPGSLQTLQPLQPHHLGPIWAALQRWNAPTLFVSHGAKWQTLTRSILAKRLAAGRVWGMREGDRLHSLFIHSDRDTPNGTLWIGWLHSTDAALQPTLQDLRHLAHQQGFGAIGGFLSDSEALRPGLTAMGYSTTFASAFRVYECTLAGS